jgi:hypothetical protein
MSLSGLRLLNMSRRSSSEDSARRADNSFPPLSDLRQELSRGRESHSAHSVFVRLQHLQLACAPFQIVVVRNGRSMLVTIALSCFSYYPYVMFDAAI